MEWMDGVVTLALGLVLRLGIPLVLTILLVRWLRRLDEGWQAEAEAQRAQAEGTTRPRNIGCWEIKGCAPEQKAVCQAFAHPETPCWQLFREGDGHLQERCLGCEVFKDAPVPVPIATT